MPVRDESLEVAVAAAIHALRSHNGRKGGKSKSKAKIAALNRNRKLRKAKKR